MIEILLVGFLLTSLVLGIRSCTPRRRATNLSPREMAEALGSTEWRLHAVVNCAMQEMLAEARRATKRAGPMVSNDPSAS